MTKNFNDTILRAYKGEKTEYTPVWYMRQAGRSHKEYLEVRKMHTLFGITHNPDICGYATNRPSENYQHDAVVLYKESMSLRPAMGIDVEIKSGIGPVIENPIRSLEDIQYLGTLHPKEDVPYV